VLRRDPRDGDSLRALHQSYRDNRLYDEAWCIARVLVFVGKANLEVQREHERGRIDGPIRPRAVLNDEAWLRLLVHEKESVVVSKIFQQLWPAVLGLRGRPDRTAGLAPKYLVDPDRSTVTLARTFGFAARTLGLGMPRLYLRQDVQGGLTHAPVWPLASLAGATLLQGFQPRDLLFVCGRHLADYRGEHYLRTLMPEPEELRVVLLAAMRLCGACPPHPQVDAVAHELRTKLLSSPMAIVGRLCGTLLAAGTDVDLVEWLRGVELTACRAGFVLADDLTTSARMIRALGSGSSVDLPMSTKIDELVRYASSEEYLALRRALGLVRRHG
jgi:hypothetical protein